MANWFNALQFRYCPPIRVVRSISGLNTASCTALVGVRGVHALQGRGLLPGVILPNSNFEGLDDPETPAIWARSTGKDINWDRSRFAVGREAALRAAQRPAVHVAVYTHKPFRVDLRQLRQRRYIVPVRSAHIPHGSALSSLISNRSQKRAGARRQRWNYLHNVAGQNF